jgi:hypothetical protein
MDRPPSHNATNNNNNNSNANNNASMSGTQTNSLSTIETVINLISHATVSNVTGATVIAPTVMVM